MTPVAILRARCGRPDMDGVLADHLLLEDRRSKKVGTLSVKARLVLEAARHCLDCTASADRIGVSLGTLTGSMDVAELCLRTVQDTGFAGVTPSWYAGGLPNAMAAIVAAMHGLQGPNLTVLGHQSGLEAIVLAGGQIRAGRVGTMLAGGFDMPSPGVAAWLQGEGAAPIHPGVGLVLLSGAVGPSDPCIVGWFQAARSAFGLIAEPGTGTSAPWASVVAAALAANGMSGAQPAVHVVASEVPGPVDYLAATAPIWLIEYILEPRRPGLHALVTAGHGPRITCLLIEVPEAHA